SDPVRRRARRQADRGRRVGVLPQIGIVVVRHDLADSSGQRAVIEPERVLQPLEFRPARRRIVVVSPTVGHSVKTAYATLRTAACTSRSSVSAWTSATSHARRGDTPLRTNAPM